MTAIKSPFIGLRLILGAPWRPYIRHVHADEMTTVNMSTSNSFRALFKTSQPLTVGEVGRVFLSGRTFEVDPSEILTMVDRRVD